jgi:NADH-ubiquinone oxidoreductase chain 3
MTIFILFVSVIALLFLFINLVFAPHNPYQEKDSMFECGFHSFQQSRSPFNIAFFIYALVYLLLDLEILLTFPFAVSGYVNNIYGLIITLGFIGMITIGFVYELGKGALKIPSKQQTYTIKNRPLIHISYVKTKSAEKAIHPFITSALQSSILPLAISIKNFRKYLTINKIIIGLIGLIVLTLVKTLGISTWIFDLLSLEKTELYEYIILGLSGSVFSILGLGFRDLFGDNYATMGGDPTQGSSSPQGAPGATNTPDRGNLPGRQTGSGGSSGGDIQSESESSSGLDTQREEGGESSSKNPSRPNYTGKRLASVLDKQIEELSKEIQNLTLSMDKSADNDSKWQELRDQRDSTIDDLEMVSQASADEVRKMLEASNSPRGGEPSLKRDTDVAKEDQAGSSKKPRK